MSLATRCPQCRTVFRVVQDQLRVSEGWVRCGRCSEVFNAAQQLVDPVTGETRRAPIEVHSGLPPPVRPEAGRVPEPRPTQRTSDPREIPPEMADFAESQIPQDEDAIVRLAPSDDWEDEPAPAPRPSAAASAAARAAAPSPARRTRPGELPSFVRRAQRAERWRHPGVRGALALGVLVTAAALAAQWLYVYRDHAAARWPGLKPLLSQACAAIGCRIQPVRAIDALAVDSSGLVRVENSELYRLGVTLRNQRDHEVALPAIDLALTDTRGQLIARRVLRASELGAAGPTVAAQGELALQATIRIASTPVAGYTIELFYP